VVIIEFPENDRKAIQEILRKLTMTYPDKIIGLYYKQGHTIQLEIATGDATKLHLGKTIKELANRIGARGGGSKTYASLRLDEDKLQTLKQELEKLTWGTG
ncbi:MAG: DHHA1 domain-containing protein, partial [Desulfurococcales archaeon]|nr:DHHA1 domain-containing protein [Desulfurococcales archaeon]